MAEYGRYCPVSIATEILADRWTPLIVRELVLGNTRFNDIARGLPGISRTLLVNRLRHLERRGILDTWPSPAGHGREYHLTAAGRDLERVIEVLGTWAIDWFFDEVRPEEVDAVTLVWWMHRRVDPSALPPHRVVVRFHFTGEQPQSLWMLLDRGEPSVCLTSPGFDDDVVVVTTIPTLSDVFHGRRSWTAAVAAEDIEVCGQPRLAAALPRWFVWSPFAEATRARLSRVATGVPASGH
ncbi:winged helix-turn-helix transcriptional regulator [Nocardioides houyundeii]|uniref:winged helix-turn-helix transcriptional regulator n=1 Tax=Nocardioides houyundeii TaxID=2045452 RepID=UPI000DF36AF8|nr:helix-turn-helix domain-containing protein [Nocardioides houyundeii]